MSNPLRKEVLKSFKQLHRLRLHKFRGDPQNLNMIRDYMNNIYKNNKNLSDQTQIQLELENAWQSYKEIAAILRVEHNPDNNSEKITDFSEHTRWDGTYMPCSELPDEPCLCFGGTKTCGNCCRSKIKESDNL